MVWSRYKRPHRCYWCRCCCFCCCLFQHNSEFCLYFLNFAFQWAYFSKPRREKKEEDWTDFKVSSFPSSWRYDELYTKINDITSVMFHRQPARFAYQLIISSLSENSKMFLRNYFRRLEKFHDTYICNVDLRCIFKCK